MADFDSLTTYALDTALRQIQQRHQLFPLPHSPTAARKLTVIVGVSGGADSVCLLHLLQRFAPEWQLALQIGHLDHALRAESATDAEFVRELAAMWGIPFHTHRLEPGALQAQGGNLEANARIVRHAYLQTLALNLTPAGQIPIVALAHHADDQAETILHHLIRGSGLSGLTGMQPKSVQDAIALSTTNPLLARTLGMLPLFTIADRNVSVHPYCAPIALRSPHDYPTVLTDTSTRLREDSTNLDQRYTGTSCATPCSRR
ncbi:MAG: tRNA lysidine(34) synthetase TilS [Caldilineaceae bacterium]